jgi:hypothetical protein
MRVEKIPATTGCALALVAQILAMQPAAGYVTRFGNGFFYDMRVGDSLSFGKTTIALESVTRQFCVFTVAGRRVDIKVSKLTPPVIAGGLRLFVADNHYVKSLTDDPDVHGLLTKDALVCLSDASLPLLDPAAYTFPISRRDGYVWDMGENSYTFSYLGPHWNDKSRFRSHEGTDLDMHDGRGIEKHPIVAVEDGVIEWSLRELGGDKNEGCVLLRSASNPGIHYVYKHLYSRSVTVNAGERVRKGDFIGYIWGDGMWGHLHFAVVQRDTVPAYQGRYTNTLNAFAYLCQLWNGTPDAVPRVHTAGTFHFGRLKGASRNVRYAQAYTPSLGYGWLIDDWCGADNLEAIPYDTVGFIKLQRTVHAGSRAECTNPTDYYDFRVRVENGTYSLRVLVGDYYEKSFQRVEAHGSDLGTRTLDKGEVAWTNAHTVDVRDGFLTVRIFYADHVSAGISALEFRRL